MTNKKHITFICSRLDLPGGTERTIVNLANLLQEKGHHVTLLVLDETDHCFYPLNPGIEIKSRNLHFGIGRKGNMLTRKLKIIHNLIQLRKILKIISPEIIISTEYHYSIASILAGGKKKSKIISWEHHHFHWLKRNRFWQYLFLKIYPKLDLVVCQNHDETPFYTKMGCRTAVIPYHIHLRPLFVQKESSKEILTVGWLIHRKGTDLLMKVANNILKKYPEWTWRIIGDGELKNQLLDFIKENILEEKLILENPSNHDITKQYQNASIFVLTSRMESFGMVLAEALCHGVPAVAFDCETGPRHVITNNEDGFLVESDNIEQLSDTISKLIEDPLLRKKIGEKAVENIQRFSPDKIYELWEQIF